MEKILFVCTANICRSPMAVGIFSALAGDAGLEVSADSAGVAALTDETAAPYALQALDELGIDISEHWARQVDMEMVRSASLVLAMTPRHRDILLRHFGSFSGAIHTLPQYANGDDSAGVPDPYGRSLGTYRASAREILEYIELVVERLQGKKQVDVLTEIVVLETPSS